MLFRKKGKLRKEFDDKLLHDIQVMKTKWHNNKDLIERSFDPTFDTICQAKLSELKYHYLFKEAKKRNVSLR